MEEVQKPSEILIDITDCLRLRTYNIAQFLDLRKVRRKIREKRNEFGSDVNYKLQLTGKIGELYKLPLVAGHSERSPQVISATELAKFIHKIDPKAPPSAIARSMKKRLKGYIL